jgi:hypothetical protein
MAKSKEVCEVLKGVKVGMGARVQIAGKEIQGTVAEVTGAYAIIQYNVFVDYEHTIFIPEGTGKDRKDRRSDRKNFWATTIAKFRLVNGSMTNFPENKVLEVFGTAYDKHFQ